MAQAIRFRCPECGHPFTSGPQVVGMKVACSECKKSFVAEAGDPLKVQAGESLVRAYHRILKALQAVPGQIRPMTALNENSPCSGFSKFIQSRDGGGVTRIFAIGSRPWSPTHEREILAQILPMWEACVRRGEGFPSVRLILPAEPPSALAYLFSNESSGNFEATCVARLHAPFAVDPVFARENAEHVRSILRAHWDLEIDPANPDHAARLEKFVLENLRGDAGPDDTVEAVDYSPRHSLLGLGCLLGEMLCRHPKLRGRWIEDEEVPFHLGVKVGLRSANATQNADPIGKLCMLYENGRRDSIVEFVRTLPKLLGELSGAA